MNVLSLFNGMGTLRQSMQNVGIKVDKYYSSEIKPYAIELQQHHFPGVIQVGDINGWRNWDIDWAKIDFIGSGSPCQDLSIAGRQKGIIGSRSSLFFIFIDILNHVRSLNPNVLFLQENVGSAPKKDVGIMSRHMGLHPVSINSKLVTAQLRDRHYWTNIKTTKNLIGETITDIEQPVDRGILLQDILESGEAVNDKSACILESQRRASGYGNNQQSLRKRTKKRFIEAVKENGKYRVLTKTELCRLQGFRDNYCDILNYNQTGSLLGDGWTLPIIDHILKEIKMKTINKFMEAKK